MIKALLFTLALSLGVFFNQVQLVDALNTIAESRKVSLVVELLTRAACQP